MKTQSWLKIGALLMFIGIGLGAFGAHFLPKKFGDAFKADVWDTAVFYHLIHALALVVVGYVGKPLGKVAPMAWFIGVICFSGSLYVLALKSVPILGPVTPLGGLAFMIGWGFLLFKKADR